MTSISICRPVYLQPRPGPNNIGSHSILFCKLSSRNVNIRSPSSMARSVLSLLVTVTTLGALVRTSLAVTCYSCSQVTSWRLTLPRCNTQLVRRITWPRCWTTARAPWFITPSSAGIRTGASRPGEATAATTWQVTWGSGLCLCRESHLQTDWASYCETTAFRFWDWTVTLARLILSRPMWTCAHSACQWGHCWLSPDQHSDRSKCENIKCPKCGESIMIKTFSHIPNIPQSPLHYCCLFLKNFFSHRVGVSNSRGSKHQPEWLYHWDQVFFVP